MKSSIIVAVSVIISSLFALSFAVANADILSASCTGAPSAASVTWIASSSGGVTPVAFLWGNGATSSVQVISEVPGMYSMSLQATDASSSIATTSCTATIVAPTLPSINSFIAMPNAITIGHSSVLSWTVSNASSTSINNGLGVVAGGSIVVMPTVTTTYELRAVNVSGTTTATATVTVTATTTPSTGSALQQKIQTLLQQIAALQQQIKQLVLNAATGGTSNATTTPPTGPHMPPGQLGKLTCITINRNLGIGSQGDDVKSLQEMLSEDGDSGFTGIPTGFFGALTAKALQRFQMQFGIATSTNGALGPLTRGFFERQCGKGLGGGDNNSSGTSTSTNSHGNDNWHASTSTVSTSTSFWNGKPWNEESTTTRANGNDHGNSHDN